jgi:hypothetical protein
VAGSTIVSGRTERTCVALAVGGGLLLAIAKAATAAITTDEAWSYNDWISHGVGRIWTDYSAPNNHVLNGLLARASLLLLGDTELALRVPALLGFALLLVACRRITRATIASPAIRVLCLATVAWHPYLIDFAACARGYSLGIGFGCTALALLAGARAPSMRRLAGASVAHGLAVASVPVLANVALAASAAFLLVDRPGSRALLARRALALAVPGAAVAVAAYGGVLGQLRPGLLSFGAYDLASSVRSLHKLLVYEPQAVVDWAGHPVTSGAVIPWRHGPLPEWLHATFDAPGFQFALLAVTAAAIATAVRAASGPPARRHVGMPGLSLLLLLVSIAIERGVAGTPWPLHRTWLVAVPLLLLAAHVAADVALRALPRRVRPAAAGVGVVAALLFLACAAGRASLTVYREWPDNAPLRATLDRLDRVRDRSAVTTVGYAWYHDACVRYWARARPSGLSLPAHREAAERPGADFVVLTQHADAARYLGYAVVLAHPPYGIFLLRRVPMRDARESRFGVSRTPTSG